MTEIHIFDTPAALGEAVARRILDGIAQAARQGRRYLLGCPTGRTPRPVYEAMAAGLARDPQPLGHVVLVMMDEYMTGAEGRWRLAEPEEHFSCAGFAERDIRTPLNAVLPEGQGVPAASVWFPDLADPAAYDARIADAGGVDFFIVASGASDGHVAFNPPGTPLSSPSRIIALADRTRQDNMASFPAFRSLEEVPTHGVSIGLHSIAASREVALLVWGAGKAEAFARVSALDAFDASWPASMIHAARGDIHADRAASG